VRKQPEGALEKRKGRILVRRNGGKSGLLGKAVGMQIWSERLPQPIMEQVLGPPGCQDSG